MKTILFNGEEKPSVGSTFVVKEVYDFKDGIYGPQRAVILERVFYSVGIEPIPVFNQSVHIVKGVAVR